MRNREASGRRMRGLRKVTTRLKYQQISGATSGKLKEIQGEIGVVLLPEVIDGLRIEQLN